jgi:homoserine kinase
MFSSIKVKAPASTANLGSSFDCLGIAVNLYNEITISINENDEFIYNGTKHAFITDDNFIFKIINKFFPERPNLKVEIENEIPLSRGLGSSSSAIASTLVAVNNLFFDAKYSLDELLNIALFFEKHPDNLCSAFFGGLVLSSINHDKVFYYKFAEFEKKFESFVKIGEIGKRVKSLLFFVPDYKIGTDHSREILFNTNFGLKHSDYIQGLNKTILNTISFANCEFKNFAESMDDKTWHQSQRKHNIKFFDEIFETSLKNGADGVSLSGSGPTILIITDDKNVQNIKDSILQINGISEIRGKFFNLKPDYEGVKVLWKK